MQRKEIESRTPPDAFDRKEIGYSFHKENRKFSIATSIAYMRRG